MSDVDASVSLPGLAGVLRRGLDSAGLPDVPVVLGHLYNDPELDVVRVDLPFLPPGAIASLLGALVPLGGHVTDDDPTLVRMSVPVAGQDAVQVCMSVDVSPVRDVASLVGDAVARFDRLVSSDVDAAAREFGAHAVALLLAGHAGPAFASVLLSLRRRLPAFAGQMVPAGESALAVLLADRLGDVSVSHAQAFKLVSRMLRAEPDLVEVGRLLDAQGAPGIPGVSAAARVVHVPVRDAAPGRGFSGQVGQVG